MINQHANATLRHLCLRVFALLMLTCIIFPVPLSAVASEDKNVLILNSYHPGYSWSDSIMAGIQQGFNETAQPINLHMEYMDTKRYSPQKVFPTLKKLLEMKFSSQQPSLIIASDNNALDFLLANRASLFPEIPIVFCGINNFSDEMIRGQTLITGITEKHGYRETLNLVRQLHPDRTLFVAVSDITESGQKNLVAFKDAARDLEDEIETTELAGLDVEVLQHRLRELPDKAVLFHLDYYLDGEGHTLSVAESFALLRDNSLLPVYVNTDNKMGFGAVGGIVSSGHLQGLTAARMAVRILQGEAPATLPIIRKAPIEPVFDYDQLREFDISLSQLPENSRIINRPTSFYHLYAPYLWLSVCFLIAQTVAIILLLANIRQRKMVEEKLSRWGHLFEHAQWGIAVGDPQTETLTIMNPAFARMHGYTEKELSKLPVKSVYAPEARAELSSHIRKAHEKGHYSFDSVHLRKDGSSFPARMDVTAVKDDAGKVIYRVVNVQDITTQQQTEETLRRNEARTRAVFATLSEGVVLQNVKGDVVEMNNAAERILGYSPQALAASVSDLQRRLIRSDGKPFPVNEQPGMVTLRTRKPVHNIEMGVPKPDGTVRWLSVSSEPMFDNLGNLSGVVTSFFDITERRQAAEELEQHRHHLEELVKERTDKLEEKIEEIERFNTLFVDRELAMIELKEKIKTLEKSSNNT